MAVCIRLPVPALCCSSAGLLPWPLHLRACSCCAGGGTWDNVGDENGTAAGAGTGISLQPFYTSGANGEFTLVNGAYQPTINMTVRCWALLPSGRHALPSGACQLAPVFHARPSTPLLRPAASWGCCS